MRLTAFFPGQLGWFGGLVARVLDLRLNSREFETSRPLALQGSKLGQLTPTGLAGRSGLVLAYLAVGEKPQSVPLLRQLL